MTTKTWKEISINTDYRAYLAPLGRLLLVALFLLSDSGKVADPIVAEIIEALARTTVDTDNNKQRRLVEFKDGCRYGKFGKTKAYELTAQQRIRAYKLRGKTMIDLDGVDEYHASLPNVVSRAS